jgi:hypothetical protein
MTLPNVSRLTYPSTAPQAPVEVPFRRIDIHDQGQHLTDVVRATTRRRKTEGVF